MTQIASVSSGAICVIVLSICVICGSGWLHHGSTDDADVT
jgi:hypothetical protein